MKLINRDADYAVKALVAVARRGDETVPVTALTAELGLPRPYLRKILQTLGRRGIVRSAKGRGGGFVLARPAGRIAVADVIRAFQGEISLHDCLFKKKLCPDVATCPLRESIGRLESRLVRDLEALTVASILKGDKDRERTRGTRVGGGAASRPAKERSQT
jgi:Rrf2 family protein